DEREVSPYVGFTYAFTESLRAYASYSDIYEPQAELGEDLAPLGSAVGKSYEVGVKGEFFDGGLLGTLSLFRAEPDNDAESEGFELEVSGRIGERVHLFGGYTQLDIEDPQGVDARTFVPRKTFKLGTRFNPAIAPKLELGGALRWSSGMYLDTPLGRIRQPSFNVLSAYARYAVSDRLELALNVDNLTDEKYLTSLYWDQAFYAAPRSAAISARLRYWSRRKSRWARAPS